MTAVKYLGVESAKATAEVSIVGLVAHGGDSCVDRLALVADADDHELDTLRHRNASGSLSSHDYEEMSTSSASLRSTPTHEQRMMPHMQHLAHSPRLAALDFDGYYYYYYY